ncbi:DUF803-domain-containing protein [Dentipellis sp. KUC8613]|nr:DUF803-domain-containing protein [Dentipellis sp. KUC8613]
MPLPSFPRGIDDIEFPDIEPATVAGISVAIAGNILISLALNLQKLAHRRLEHERVSNNAAELPSDAASLELGTERPLHIADLEPNPWDSFGNNTEPNTPQTEPPSRAETAPLISFSTPSNPSTPPHRTPRTPPIPRAYGATVSEVDIPVSDIPVRGKGKKAQRNTINEDDAHDSGNGLGGAGEETVYLKSKLWWSGFLLMNVGELGNFISYAFAPASVVAPLGTFALIANCVFAPFLLGERFRKRDLLGIALAVFGAVTVVLSTNTSSTRLSPSDLIHAISQRHFIVYTLVYVVAAVVLAGLSEGPRGRQWVLVDVGICALFGGFTVLATKGVSTLLTMEWIDMFKEWITYPIIVVLIGTGVGQIKYLNRALMRFDSKVVIPTQFVLFNLSAIVGSALLYGDFKRAKYYQFVTFVYGCLATFAGVWVIASGPSSERTGVEEGQQRRRGKARVAVVRPRGSTLSLVGLSPAQRLLLVHTPSVEEGVEQ